MSRHACLLVNFERAPQGARRLRAARRNGDLRRDAYVLLPPSSPPARRRSRRRRALARASFRMPSATPSPGMRVANPIARIDDREAAIAPSAPAKPAGDRGRVRGRGVRQQQPHFAGPQHADDVRLAHLATRARRRTPATRRAPRRWWPTTTAVTASPRSSASLASRSIVRPKTVTASLAGGPAGFPPSRQAAPPPRAPCCVRAA